MQSRILFRTVFRLTLFAILANLVLTQNLFTSPLEDTRNALMSFSSGSTETLTTVAHTTKTSKSATMRVSFAGPLPKKPSSPSNMFLEALDQIERAVYEAQAAGSRYTHSLQRLVKIKANIKLAIQKRNYLFARQSLGHALYTAMELESKSGRKRRSGSSAAKRFMDSMKKELGGALFDSFLSVNGDVTLMFAIDDTGSMGDEIQAAKEIAKSIVNHIRYHDVDYILSPFNDPGTGPVTYKSETERFQFVDAINALRAHDGGDCPELTFKGILDAMAEGPRPGSPMYVFTDATAKDATTENIEETILFAQTLDLTINFFTTGLCGKSSYKPFEDLARETCGLMLELPKSSDLGKLTGVARLMLGGTTCMGGSNNIVFSGRKKRRVTSQYNILIDDSTEKVIVSVSTENSMPSINLKNPLGFPFTSDKTSFPKGAIFEINHPRPGTWRLTVSGAGKHSYTVKGSSKTNVDFEFFFVMIPSSGTNRKPIPVSHPLRGETAMVIITVAGANMIDSKSLSLDLMSTDGRKLGTAALKAHGSSGTHFSASFLPPSIPFRLTLKGNTKTGYAFERNSRNVVHPSHALIRVLYARNEYTISAGESGFVMFAVYNTGATEIFDITVKDRKNYVAKLRRTNITVRKGRTSFFSVTFKTPSSAVPGTMDAVLATVKGRTSKTTVSHAVNLMVV